MVQTYNTPATAVDSPTDAVGKLVTMIGTVANLFLGDSAPSTTFPAMLWAQGSTGIIWQRNAADSAWVAIARLAQDGFRQPLPVGTFALAGTNIYLPSPWIASTVKRVTIVSPTATSGSSGTDRWEFQIRNVTAGVDLLSAAQTTEAAEILANTVYAITPDQNQDVLADAVLRLEITQTGTPTAVASALIVVEFGVD